MQLNIYVPKEKTSVLMALDRKAQSTKRPKNELVLEALEQYLQNTEPAELGRFGLGAQEFPKRGELYEGRSAK